MFKLRDPKAVTAWVDAQEESLKSKRKLTIDVFLKALGSGPIKRIHHLAEA
jgi:hypothetical protein